MFYGNCELRNITVESENDYLIYPYEIKRTVKRIMSGSLANFGDKHEIMNLFSQAVNNGNNPYIISSQLNTASIASKNKPQSTYYSPNLFLLLRR